MSIVELKMSNVWRILATKLINFLVPLPYPSHLDVNSVMLGTLDDRWKEETSAKNVTAMEITT